VSFIWSAFFVSRIRRPEPTPATTQARQAIVHEIVEGLRFVYRNPILRALGSSTAIFALSGRMFGAVFLFYVASDLGFHPCLLGVIFAIGGVSSFVGAIATGRITRRLGVGPALMVAMLMIALGRIMIVAVTDTSWLAVGLLVAPQLLSDPFWTLYEISHVSVRQASTPDRWQGRMNASLQSLDFGGMLIGAFLGGWLGDTIGARTTLLIASLATLLAAIPLLVPAVRGLKEAPVVDSPVEDPVDELP